MKSIQAISATKILTGTIAAFLLFTALFSDPFINFWHQMALTVVILCGMAFGFEKHQMAYILHKDLNHSFSKTIGIGILSAVVLYCVFYIGNKAAGFINGGTDQIADVYTLKHNNPAWMMALIITFIVGPGEELFWRGFIQRILSKDTGFGSVIITSLLYCMVHIASGNIMLLTAALVCGLFWGLLYIKFRNIYINMISHVIWDLMVFLIFPFN